jgi:hypothetical protein
MLLGSDPTPTICNQATGDRTPACASVLSLDLPGQQVATRSVRLSKRRRADSNRWKAPQTAKTQSAANGMKHSAIAPLATTIPS